MAKTCQWLLDADDPARPVCDKPAPHRVTVKTKITTAVVYLCDQHKQEHNVSFANLRTTTKH